MKAGLHPEYNETVIRCACGAEYPTRSTKGSISVEICAKCHPFFTGKNQFVDFSKSNKTMLAHNDLVEGTTNGSWVEFNMYLSYRNITTRPTYVIVSACASRYGDSFTGGKGSVMWVDEFQFIYDPMELSETDRNAFFALFK